MNGPTNGARAGNHVPIRRVAPVRRLRCDDGCYNMNTTVSRMNAGIRIISG